MDQSFRLTKSLGQIIFAASSLLLLVAVSPLRGAEQSRATEDGDSYGMKENGLRTNMFDEWGLETDVEDLRNLPSGDGEDGPDEERIRTLLPDGWNPDAVVIPSGLPACVPRDDLEEDKTLDEQDALERESAEYLTVGAKIEGASPNITDITGNTDITDITGNTSNTGNTGNTGNTANNDGAGDPDDWHELGCTLIESGAGEEG